MIPSDWRENRCSDTVHNGYKNYNSFKNSTVTSRTSLRNFDGKFGDGHDYNKALILGTLFLDSMRSGGISKKVENRVPWLGHSNLKDGCQHENHIVTGSIFLSQSDCIKT